MLGLFGVALLGTVAFRYMGYSSLQDLQPSPDQEAGLIQRWLQPYKERIQVSCSVAGLQFTMSFHTIGGFCLIMVFSSCAHVTCMSQEVQF